VAHSWQHTHTARFGARRWPSGTVITVEGELDAANADQLAAYLERSVRPSERVILDLRGLKFIGTAGFSALHRINVVCSSAGARWTMAPSPAVSRLLRLCDPDGTLPAAPCTDDGELLQLVAEPR